MEPSEHSRERGAGVSWGWVAIWCAFVAYAAWLAPPNDPVLLGRVLAAFRTASLVHVMTIDLVVCACLLVVLAREGHGESPLAPLRWLPVLGVAIENAVLRRAADPRGSPTS